MAGDGHFAAQNALLGTPKEPTLPSPPPWRAIRCSFSLLKKYVLRTMPTLTRGLYTHRTFRNHGSCVRERCAMGRMLSFYIIVFTGLRSVFNNR